MKTLNILALVFALTLSPVFASANDISDSSTVVIQEKIQNTVRLENNDENTRVFVVFSIEETGAVSVLQVATLDAAIKASITEQFQSMSFDNTAKSYEGTYSIWLNFKSL